MGGIVCRSAGWLNTLVFGGGIGENAPVIRSRICEGLGYLGVKLDRARNERSASVISADASRVAVRVIRTDEEVMIAKAVASILAQAEHEKHEIRGISA